MCSTNEMEHTRFPLFFLRQIFLLFAVECDGLLVQLALALDIPRPNSNKFQEPIWVLGTLFDGIGTGS